MQPFERLRSLARWGDADDELLVEIAACLAEFDHDPAGLVVACRRLLDHHRDWGPLWWLCAHVLGASGAGPAATRALDEIAGDETATRVASALPFPADAAIVLIGWSPVGAHLLAERPDLTLRAALVDPTRQPELPPIPALDDDELVDVHPSHVVVVPIATSASRVLLPDGGERVLDACPATTRSWLAVPVGFALPDRLLDALATAADRSVFVAAQRFDRVVGPRGLAPPDALVRRIDTPVAPELLRPLP